MFFPRLVYGHTGLGYELLERLVYRAHRRQLLEPTRADIEHGNRHPPGDEHHANTGRFESTRESVGSHQMSDAEQMLNVQKSGDHRWLESENRRARIIAPPAFAPGGDDSDGNPAWSRQASTKGGSIP